MTTPPTVTRPGDGSSASPLTLAGKPRLPGLVADLTIALFAQSVLGPFGAVCELTLSARFEGPLRKPLARPSVLSNIGRIETDFDATVDHRNRDDERRLWPLADQAPGHASQGTVDDLDEIAFVQERTRIKLQIR